MKDSNGLREDCHRVSLFDDFDALTDFFDCSKFAFAQTKLV